MFEDAAGSNNPDEFLPDEVIEITKVIPLEPIQTNSIISYIQLYSFIIITIKYLELTNHYPLRNL